MQLRPLARAGFGGALFGLAAYSAGSLANDLLTYSKLSAAALELAAADEALVETLGAPLGPGPWYNASLGFSHRGRVATCSFQLKGALRCRLCTGDNPWIRGFVKVEDTR